MALGQESRKFERDDLTRRDLPTVDTLERMFLGGLEPNEVTGDRGRDKEPLLGCRHVRHRRHL